MADTAEPTKKAQDTATRTGQAATDAAAKTAKAAVNQTEQMTRQASEKAAEIEQAVAENITETAEAAAEMSSKVTDQGRDVMLMGVRTAAGVGGRIADISYGRGHHLLNATMQAMDIYRDATERSTDRLQALFGSYVALSRGVQQMQHAWLEMLDHTMENAARKPHDLLRCNNVIELAEVQRDLYLEAIQHAFDASSRLLEMAGRTVQDAAKPMQSTHH